jgi:glycosyltransferase involved in cell wall biosynthesis
MVRNVVSSGNELRVFYGYDRLPGIDDVASGGIVKCQDLQKTFPNTPHGFNLLYLVSSSLPDCAPMMVRFARKAGAKFVLNQNGVAYPAWHGPGWQETNRPLSHLVHEAEYVFYQSKFCKMSADRFLGAREGRSEILYNPVDTTTFVPAPGGRSPDKLVLLAGGSHGQFYRIKSTVETFAQVLKERPDARLIVAGSFRWRGVAAAAKEEFDVLCRQLRVEHAVEFRGVYTQTEAVSLFQSAHIILHTTYNDVCPRLVVEAMSCGLPVVYSKSGGVPELVGETAGIGVPVPPDWDQIHVPAPEDFSAAVSKVAARLPEFARAARERAVQHLDVKPWIERHKIVFEEVLK